MNFLLPRSIDPLDAMGNYRPTLLPQLCRYYRFLLLCSGRKSIVLNFFIVMVNVSLLAFMIIFYDSMGKQRNAHDEYVTVTRLDFLYFFVTASVLVINGILIPWNTNRFGARIEFFDDLMFLVDVDAQVYNPERL